MLLKDGKFVFLANRNIREHFTNNSNNPLGILNDLDPTCYQFLDQNINPNTSSQSLLATITGTAIKRSHDIRKEKTILIDILEGRIERQVHILENSNELDNTDNLDILSRLKAELTELQNDNYTKKTHELKVSDLFEEEKPSKDFTQSVYRPRPQNISSQIYQERPTIPDRLLTTQKAVEKEINYRFNELYAYRECNDAEEDIKMFTDLSNI